jgi:hypothetical protein
MKTAPARWLPGPGTRPEALVKEARRRQRRRYVTVGVAVVAVLGSAAGVAAGLHRHAGSPVAARHAAPAPARIPASVGTTVLMWPAGSGSCCGPVAVDNLRTGRLAQSQQPAISAATSSRTARAAALSGYRPGAPNAHPADSCSGPTPLRFQTGSEHGPVSLA